MTRHSEVGREAVNLTEYANPYIGPKPCCGKCRSISITCGVSSHSRRCDTAFVIFAFAVLRPTDAARTPTPHPTPLNRKVGAVQWDPVPRPYIIHSPRTSVRGARPSFLASPGLDLPWAFPEYAKIRPLRGHRAILLAIPGNTRNGFADLGRSSDCVSG